MPVLFLALDYQMEMSFLEAIPGQVDAAFSRLWYIHHAFIPRAAIPDVTFARFRGIACTTLHLVALALLLPLPFSITRYLTRSRYLSIAF